MLSLIFFGVVITLVIIFLGCFMRKIPVGYVGVKVNLYGSSKGVNPQVVEPGICFIGINQELHKFPTFTKGIYNETTFQTSEGVTISVSVKFFYHIQQDMMPGLFEKYGKDINKSIRFYLVGMIRDAFNKFGSTIPVESVYGPGKIEFMNDVENSVKGSVKDIGIEVEQLYLVGAMRLPPKVIASLNAKIEATQKAEQSENELRQTKAEADKKIIAAKCEAEATKILLGSLTLEELRRYEATKKWDGKLPKYSAGDSTPMFSIPMSKES
jgi:regulator of protease activity HflC (stomatin/prohibitin superfamily)